MSLQFMMCWRVLWSPNCLAMMRVSGTLVGTLTRTTSSAALWVLTFTPLLQASNRPPLLILLHCYYIVYSSMHNRIYTECSGGSCGSMGMVMIARQLNSVLGFVSSLWNNAGIIIKMRSSFMEWVFPWCSSLKCMLQREADHCQSLEILLKSRFLL